jgi:uncharacterized protein (DUF1800 family)
MTRRAVWIVALSLLATGTACDEIAARGEEFVLSRIGYGPDPWSLARLRQLGVRAYIEEQLAPETIDDTAVEAEIASLFPALSWETGRIRNTYDDFHDPAMAPVVALEQLTQAAVIRAVRSRRQLVEVLVDFWFNHLNVDGSAESQRWSVVSYERDAIRPFVLGRFADMLRASSRHFAMLEYLDNSANFLQGVYTADIGGVIMRRNWGPNENFAREILELHTVGVAAPYTLLDIQAVARAFTGFTSPVAYVMGDTDTGTLYAPDVHDTSAKHVMGQLHIPAGGSGYSDSDAVIDHLAQHPLTARRIAFKLCQRFVSETPSEALVARVTQTYLQTGGDLREVTRAVLFSRDFLIASSYRTKVKRPLVFLASAARAVGVSDDVAFSSAAIDALAHMGGKLFSAEPPTGYPETSDFWVGESALVSRSNAAYQAAIAEWGFAPIPSTTTVPDALVDELAAKLVHGGIDPATRARLIELANELPRGARAQEIVGTLLMTPEFQLH